MTAQTGKKIPIEQQVEGIEAAIKVTKGLTLHEMDGLLGAHRFLKWAQDNPDILHTASLIWKDDRARQVRDAFPGATLTAVRKTGAEFTDD